MSRFQIDVQASEPIEDHLVQTLERAAALALERQQAAENVALTVRLATAEEVQQLNRTYRGQDSQTDVLSFEINDTLPDGSFYLGDIVIATEVAREQARAAGHALLDELALLVIHGVLHLMGHDHADDAQKAAMWAQQRDVLAALGLNAMPTES
ncbi:MAG: rRNA maturation RNase YbeY [Chloroflexota bacterium]